MVIMESAFKKKLTMVNVRGDLWYEIVDISTDFVGKVVSIKAGNGTWYKVSEIKGLA